MIKLRRDEDALSSFDRAIELHAEYAVAHYNKAVCYALQGQVRSALGNLKRAIDIDPGYRDEARTDPDFVPIGEDERFWRLLQD